MRDLDGGGEKVTLANMSKLNKIFMWLVKLLTVLQGAIVQSYLLDPRRYRFNNTVRQSDSINAIIFSSK
jgi:hypothetical protein